MTRILLVQEPHEGCFGRPRLWRGAGRDEPVTN
jgi:hypothetical protein